MSDGLTDQQRKWLASVRATLETTTGRSLADWVAIAATCPETAPRARQKWLKDHHGLGQNYAMLVLSEVASVTGTLRRDSAAMGAALWADADAAAVRAALQAEIDALPDTVTGQRKTFTSWSRNFAFAAARPLKTGGVRLALALAPDADPCFEPPGRESWSERLLAATTLATPADVAGMRAPLRRAWEAS